MIKIIFIVYFGLAMFLSLSLVIFNSKFLKKRTMFEQILIFALSPYIFVRMLFKK
jgi:hypothetical protein